MCRGLQGVERELATNGQLRLDCSSAAGAPTLTTPTLTPTTLRNIEQMFLEASDQNLEHPIVHQNAAHFVPPPVAMELPASATSSTSASTLSAPIPGPTSITIPLPGPSALSLVVPDVPLPGPPPPDSGPSTAAEASASIRKRVSAARVKQAERFQNSSKTHYNAQMSTRQIRAYCALDHSSSKLLKQAMERLSLSARAYDRILKVARTIVDLERLEQVSSNHIAEAIHDRSLEREWWMG